MRHMVIPFLIHLKSYRYNILPLMKFYLLSISKTKHTQKILQEGQKLNHRFPPGN